MNKFTYLVIENAPDVCEGIIRRMEKYEEWISLGYCVSVKQAIEKISEHKPNLLFLDWGLNGGSAFEILQQIQNLPSCNPYIIFNTGFQKDNPEIPQEIINNYKVDKYLVKPLWENLRQFLPQYLKEAVEKTKTNHLSSKKIWLTDNEGAKIILPLDKLLCICQHPSLPRKRIFYCENDADGIVIPLQWDKCIELLRENNIDFFITKNRSHLVIKKYIEKFEKPFVRLRNFPAKVEVVKDAINDFEQWLYDKNKQ
ncbi:MAG: response regulator [Bacteroidetes bacterium]|nr:response regulator [Bacteroidota bacterium]